MFLFTSDSRVPNGVLQEFRSLHERDLESSDSFAGADNPRIHLERNYLDIHTSVAQTHRIIGFIALDVDTRIYDDMMIVASGLWSSLQAAPREARTIIRKMFQEEEREKRK